MYSSLQNAKRCPLYCAIFCLYNPSFLIKPSTFHKQQPLFISVTYAFRSPVLSPRTRYNATNTTSILYFCAAITCTLFAQRHGFKFLIHVLTPKNFLLPECSIVIFLFHLHYNMKDTRCYIFTPRFLDIILYCIVLFSSAKIFVSYMWKLWLFRTQLRHSENNSVLIKNSYCIFKGCLESIILQGRHR
jgi:hypothetical protein